MSDKPAYLEDWHVVSYEGPCNDPKWKRAGRHGTSVCMGVERFANAPHECLATMTADSEERAEERADLAAAAPALVRALLSVEWGFPEDAGGDEAYCSACETFQVGRTPNASVSGHARGCALDAALTLAGFHDAASRDAARARMREAK